jgi:hypothetical protein
LRPSRRALALRGLKIGAGDEVILAAYDFPGNFRAIEAVGARPVIIDLAAGSWSLDVAQVAKAIAPRTKAVIASHLHGWVRGPTGGGCANLPPTGTWQLSKMLARSPARLSPANRPVLGAIAAFSVLEGANF